MFNIAVIRIHVSKVCWQAFLGLLACNYHMRLIENTAVNLILVTYPKLHLPLVFSI